MYNLSQHYQIILASLCKVKSCWLYNQLKALAIYAKPKTG